MRLVLQPQPDDTESPTMDTSLTYTGWTASLAARGLSVLPSSHAVPVQLWVREGDHVLHLLARGTTVTLRRYHASDLTGLILRSECDCAEHRTAGAGRRTVLAPDAVALAEVVFDGRTKLGWRGVEAGLVDVPTAAALFDRLHAELPQVDAPRAGVTAVA
ncbi:MAG TPA: hypothetical protein VLA97_17400 [Nocardioidaceae bacterium]|nr:hypothetical protein [Nocardioidaceae bacterium]